MALPARLVYQKQTGLGGIADAVAPTHLPGVRATIPVLEALRKAGATVVPGAPAATPAGAPLWDITLAARSQPQGVVAEHCYDGVFALRLDMEEPFPDAAVVDFWTTLSLQPCPVCGASIVWWEAGYVPGYRVCAGPMHHHLMPARKGEG